MSKRSKHHGQQDQDMTSPRAQSAIAHPTHGGDPSGSEHSASTHPISRDNGGNFKFFKT